MNQPCLKLTAYYGERQRVHFRQPRFLADAMLDLFGNSDVATSVVLRATAGFGPRRELRSDISLSLSEDPTVAVAAVDVELKIRGLLADIAAMTGRGLVTLERARLVTRQLDTDALREVDRGNGDAARLTVYVVRRERIAGRLVHYVICDLLYRYGFASAIVLLGVDGTVRGERRRAHYFGPNVNVPLIITAVGSISQAAAVATDIAAVVPNALLTVERVRVCKRDGDLLARPQQLPMSDVDGRPIWQRLTVYTDGLPIHVALMQRLLRSGAARGATVLRGIWGFQGDHKPHGDKLFQVARMVPVTTIIVDTPDSILRSFSIVDELTGRGGLVTSERVPAVLSLDESQRLGDVTEAL